jgi:universal stress protein E
MTAARVLLAVRNPDARRQPSLAKAIQVARALGASLEFFHAITDSVFIELGRTSDDALERLRERVEGEARVGLARMAAVARKHGVQAECSVEWDYPPHEAVMRRVAATSATLIIAECHKGTRTRPWLIHLTDWELLRLSPVPVLLLKSGKPYRRPLTLAAVDPAHVHAKPSALDDRIIAAATELAHGLRGPLHVMHANYPTIVGTSVEAAAKKAASSWSTLSLDGLLEQERAVFEAFRSQLGVPRTRAHLVEGNPTTAIPRLAKKLGAGIVVMGALSRSGLQRIFIGNTAERVLGALPCDVLVVKPETLAPKVASDSRGMRVHARAPLVPAAH